MPSKSNTRNDGLISLTYVSVVFLAYFIDFDDSNQYFPGLIVGQILQYFFGYLSSKSNLIKLWSLLLLSRAVFEFGNSAPRWQESIVGVQNLVKFPFENKEPNEYCSIKTSVRVKEKQQK